MGCLHQHTALALLYCLDRNRKFLKCLRILITVVFFKDRNWICKTVYCSSSFVVCKITFCSEFPDISDSAGRKTRRRRTQAIAKRYAFHSNAINTKNTRWNWQWKIPHTDLKRWTLCFSLYKNCKLKVNPWWVRARQRKKSAFFETLLLSEGNFLNICVLSQCIVLLLVFKMVESLQCILKHHVIFAKPLIHSQRWIKKPVEHLRRSFLAKIANALESLTIFAR